MSRLTARVHYAAAYYSSTWNQDRQRLLWSGMTTRQQWIGHKTGEWLCAKELRDVALLAGDDTGYARYDAMMDSLSADLDALEEVA
jgi:hypothetical protein